MFETQILFYDFLWRLIDHHPFFVPFHLQIDRPLKKEYPSNQPYYFSEGTIKFFDQEFARIRSFSLSIANNEEPRYYIGKQGARARGPYEIKEGPRDYALSASVVLPDADKNAAATIGGSGDAGVSQDTALELFKQLLLEGDYGAGGGSKESIFFTPNASYMSRYALYKLCILGFDMAICSCVCAIVTLCVCEKMFGSATGIISTLESKSVALICFSPPTTSYG